MDAGNSLLSKKTNKKIRFPWLNVVDIELCCLSLENEDWIDPCSLPFTFKHKAISMRVNFIPAEVVGFNFSTH